MAREAMLQSGLEGRGRDRQDLVQIVAAPAHQQHRPIGIREDTGDDPVLNRAGIGEEINRPSDESLRHVYAHRPEFTV
jgi:hypothetical protein